MQKSARPAAVPPRALIAAALLLRQCLLRLADRVVPADVAVLDRVITLPMLMSIRAAVDLGIPDLLASGPRTAAELAREAGADTDALHRVLRYLASAGIFAMDREGRFRHNRLSTPLRTDAPGPASIFPGYVTIPSMLRAWGSFTEAVRTGKSAFDSVHGKSVWDHFEEHPDEGAVFDKGMSVITRDVAPVVAASYPFAEIQRVCDVAGGRGMLLSAILAQHPHLKGVLFDRAPVLEGAPPVLGEHGVRDRVELAPGSFFERVVEGCDAYLLKDILHDWNDARCVEILSACRRAMAPGARVIIIEMLVERNEPNLIGSQIDVMMMTLCTDGRQRSEEEMKSLLARSGFRPGRVFRPAFYDIVEGIAA
jgi:hypothetical protein